MAYGSILIVSQEVSFARALQITLVAKGYEVTNTTSIDDAVRLSDSGKYDLVLLDDDTSPATTLRACREIRAYSDTGIIVVSEETSKEARARAIDAGADTYVSKPFGVAEIFSGVRKNMRRVRVNSEVLVS